MIKKSFVGLLCAAMIAGSLGGMPVTAYAAENYVKLSDKEKLNYDYIYSYEKNVNKGKDYTVSYKKNKKKGTATLKVTGKGNFKGAVSLDFIIE